MAPGRIHTLSVAHVQRIAVADPQVADVTIVSPTEIMVHAKKTGSTSLIVWDAQGQHDLTIQVVDPQPQLVNDQVEQLLKQLKFDRVHTAMEGGKVFLVGAVNDEAQKDALEEMASTFQGLVVNLVQVEPEVTAQGEAAALAPAAPLVKLAVQVVEINRSDLERLGVKWSDSVGFTQEEVTNQTNTKALFHWGTSVTRTSLSTTLNALVRQNRARILSEPKLVTTSGKEASSFIGLDVPIVTATTFSTTTAATSASVEFRKTGVLLTMTPNVIATDEGQKITTVIEAEVSGIESSVALQIPVGSQTVSVPGFKVRKANTEVTTRSGEAIMIAGLLEVEDTRKVDQVPALGSIPVLGRLFRSPDTASTRRELVIAVTPEIVGQQRADARPTSSTPSASASQAKREETLEQAFAIAKVVAPTSDPVLDYALRVQQQIAKAIRYPGHGFSAESEGRVKLRLHVSADGALQEARVIESSGVESFDQEALRSAMTQGPYPVFPSTIPKKDLWLEIPVLFQP